MCTIATFLMLLFLAAAPAATTTAPATTPAAATTQSAQVDLSSPKSAARSLFLAIQAKDVAALRAIVDAGDEITPEVNDALAQLLLAGGRMSDAGAKRFGKSGDPIGRPMITPGTIASVDTAAVKETGDTAALQIPGHRRTMTFRRRDGNWRLVPEAIVIGAGGTTQPVPLQQLKLLRNMATAMNELAREIENGKYQSSQEAERYVQERLHAVMIEMFKPDRSATTRATTQP
jgi:hypothetical protein